MADAININIMVVAILLGISIVGSKLSHKLGFPGILIFILVGVIAKVCLPFFTHVSYREYKEHVTSIANFLGVIALTFILFSGGVNTHKKHIYPIWKSGMVLSLLGTLITALCTGSAIFILAPWLGISISVKKSILIGSILASTDAAAVFSILRSHKIKLKAHLGHLLELESGSNDVMVYFLMTLLLGLIQDPNKSLWGGFPTFFMEMTVGALGGVIAGFLMVFIINKIKLPTPSLYAPLSIALIFFPYAAVNLLHGSGYLAVYIAGLILGNHDFVHRKSIVKFYEGFGWLLEIAMFIALGLLFDLQMLPEIAPLGLALSIIMMFFVRPLSVFITMFRSTFDVKQKLFISWVGLRGAVPIVFATYLYGQPGIEHSLANKLFHLIFFVVLVSVFVQGSTLKRLAERLDLKVRPKPGLTQTQQELSENEQVGRIFMQLEIGVGSPVHKKPIVDIGLPEHSFIALVCRDKRYFTARGSTVLYDHDKLFVITPTKKELQKVKACLGIV